jgi:hypothetical protein
MKTDPRVDWEEPVPAAPVTPDEPDLGDARLWDEFDASAAVGVETAGVEAAEPLAEPPAAAVVEWEQLRLWAPEEAAPVAPPSKRRWRRRRSRSRWWRRTLRTALTVVLVMAVLVGYSVVGALRAPGTESAVARLAEWARDHHGTALVNWAERVTYKPPKVGGAPDQAIALHTAGNRGGTGAAAPATPAPATPAPATPAPAAATPPTTRPNYGPTYPADIERFPELVPAKVDPPKPKGPIPLPAPAPIPPITDSPVPDEGVWQVLQSVGDKPVLRATYLRADATYTSYLSAVAWMDTKLLQFELHPGAGEPGGGPWAAGASIPPGERGDVIAAFNSGFRMADSRGGFYLGGRTSGTMREGAATIGFYNDGSVKVGQWGREIQMTPDLYSARQNLDLIVDDGQVNWKIDDNSGYRWGATLGNDLFVWRSGVGVTESGALVYASGPRLSAATLANLLIRAGAVRAMELDINPTWTIFIHYTATPDGSIPNKLLPQMSRPATLYDTTSSRDFIVARVRPTP